MKFFFIFLLGAGSTSFMQPFHPTHDLPCSIFVSTFFCCSPFLLLFFLAPIPRFPFALEDIFRSFFLLLPVSFSFSRHSSENGEKSRTHKHQQKYFPLLPLSPIPLSSFVRSSFVDIGWGRSKCGVSQMDFPLRRYPKSSATHKLKGSLLFIVIRATNGSREDRNIIHMRGGMGR